MNEHASERQRSVIATVERWDSRSMEYVHDDRVPATTCRAWAGAGRLLTVRYNGQMARAKKELNGAFYSYRSAGAHRHRIKFAIAPAPL